MHLTLAFLGQVADERLAGAIDATRAAIRADGADGGHRPFDLTIDHSGRFPATGRPSVLWLGVGAGLDELTRLAAAAARALADREFALEARPFSAHLTLARVRLDATGPELRTISAAFDALPVPELRVRVDRIAVVESRLSPGGSRYTTRADVPLL